MAHSSKYLGVHIVTMELGQEFSLEYTFHWDLPITAVQQESISTYGNDEDRIRLAQHASVSIASLEALAQVGSAEVRVAVAKNPLTPLESIARMSHDRDRTVRIAATEAIGELPEAQQVAARAMVTTPIQRVRSLLGRKAA